MLNAFETELERAETSRDHEATNTSPTARAVRQREAHLIMEALVREYMKGAPRSFGDRCKR
jgi:hypothetical protein